MLLKLYHTEHQTSCQASHQASAAGEASDLCNGSGTHFECQVKRHHRLALVTLQLHLTLDVPLDAWCGYTLKRLCLMK